MRGVEGTIGDRGMDYLIPKSNLGECEAILSATPLARTETVDFSLNSYQEAAAKTAIYPKKFSVTYPILGLANEGGEVAGKLKKMMRDEDFDAQSLTDEQRDALIDEMGDVMWYLAAAASDLGVLLSEVADRNLQKLYSRQERGVLSGSGDNR